MAKADLFPAPLYNSGQYECEHEASSRLGMSQSASQVHCVCRTRSRHVAKMAVEATHCAQARVSSDFYKPWYWFQNSYTAELPNAELVTVVLVE